MSVQYISLTRATLALWKHPVDGDLPGLLEVLREARTRFGERCVYISIAPTDLINPTVGFMRKVGEIMDDMFRCFAHSVSVVEGTGVQPMLTRALQSSLFTMTGYAQRIAIVPTLPEAFKRLAPLVGVDRALWHAEAREHPLLVERVITAS